MNVIPAQAGIQGVVAAEWLDPGSRLKTCRDKFRRSDKEDGFVKSLKMLFSVIPAQAGIQSVQIVINFLDSGFHRSDDETASMMPSGTTSRSTGFGFRGDDDETTAIRATDKGAP